MDAAQKPGTHGQRGQESLGGHSFRSEWCELKLSQSRGLGKGIVKRFSCSSLLLGGRYSKQRNETTEPCHLLGSQNSPPIALVLDCRAHYLQTRELDCRIALSLCDWFLFETRDWGPCGGLRSSLLRGQNKPHPLVWRLYWWQLWGSVFVFHRAKDLVI